MHAEYQSPESRIAAIEGSYSYTDSVDRSSAKSQPTNDIPADYFSYKVVKRFLDVSLVVLSFPIILLAVGIVATLVKLSSPTSCG